MATVAIRPLPSGLSTDLYYIENWTLGFDFKILFLTFSKALLIRTPIDPVAGAGRNENEVQKMSHDFDDELERSTERRSRRNPRMRDTAAYGSSGQGGWLCV